MTKSNYSKTYSGHTWGWKPIDKIAEVDILEIELSILIAGKFLFGKAICIENDRII